MPWGYVRAKVAERWNCLPWEVDAAPKGEIEEALLIMSLEATAHNERQRRQSTKRR